MGKTGFSFRIRDLELVIDHPADRKAFMHAAAVGLYANKNFPMIPDDPVEVKFHPLMDGGARSTVRQVLEWVRSPEGEASIGAESDAYLRELKALANKVLGPA